MGLKSHTEISDRINPARMILCPKGYSHNLTLTFHQTAINQQGASRKSANPLFLNGTRDENRTRTGLLPRDFKSLASTSSATRAKLEKLGYYLQ